MCRGTGVLAMRDNFGHVMECGCGTLHVTVGPVTLAVDARALRTLYDMLGEAISTTDTADVEIHRSQQLPVHTSHLAVKKVLKVKH